MFRTLGHANLYSQFRPGPPAAIIEQIIAFTKSKINRPLQKALDIGCGSGQSTLALTPYFQQVIGSDESEAQIKLASEKRSAPNVEYRVSSAESLDFPDSSFDLVTASQSIHWFDRSKVFSEVKRILAPNGTFAAYGYWIPLPILENPDKAKILRELIVDHLHNGVLDKYWCKERYIVRNYYKDIELPFNNCVRNNTIVKQSISTVSEYIGYLSSWSAYQLFLQEDPVAAPLLLEDMKNRIMNIIEADSSPEETTLNLSTDYFLLMGNKEVS